MTKGGSAWGKRGVRSRLADASLLRRPHLHSRLIPRVSAPIQVSPRLPAIDEANTADIENGARAEFWRLNRYGSYTCSETIHMDTVLARLDHSMHLSSRIRKSRWWSALFAMRSTRSRTMATVGSLATFLLSVRRDSRRLACSPLSCKQPAVTRV